MYTKQEASRLKQAFWTTFGQYMLPVLSADGIKVNWVNYKTGISGIHFRMDADARHASIAIVLSQHDIDKQIAHYEQLQQLKNVLHAMLGEDWEWQYMIQDEYGKTISQVSKTIVGVNVFRQEDWPALISFFKQKISALDAFWSDAKYGFEL